MPYTLEKAMADAQAELKEGTTAEPAEPAEPTEPTATTEEPADSIPTADEAAPAPKAEEPAEPEGEEPSDHEFLDYLSSEFGEDLRGNFTSDEEAIRSLLNARHLVGRRDEDAQYGRAMRSILQGKEQQLANFLAEPAAAKQTATGTPSPASGQSLEDFPDDAASWQFQISRDAEGNLVPAPGAPKDIVERYQGYSQALARRLEEMARAWPNVSQLPDALDSKLQSFNQAEAQKQEAKAISDWEDRYKAAMFIGGRRESGLSADGQRIAVEYERLANKYEQYRDRFGNPVPASELLRDATRLVLGDQSNVTAGKAPGKRATSRAVRSPDVGGTTKKYKNIEDEISQRIEGGEDYAKVMTDIHKRLDGGLLG